MCAASLKTESNLKGSQLRSPPLVTVIFNHPILIEKNNERVLLLLNSRVCEKGEFGEIGFLDVEFGRVLTEVSIDKDVTIKLSLYQIGRSENVKNIALRGDTVLDFFLGIIFDLRAYIDSSDGATPYEYHRKGCEEDENSTVAPLFLCRNHNISPYHDHRER